MKIAALFIVSLAYGTAVYAHPVVPQSVEEFVRTHPESTVQDIRQFMLFASPTSTPLSTREIRALLRSAQTTDMRDTAAAFIRLGATHILSGLDHLLFLLAILLSARSVREILKLTAVFTAAHTATLIVSELSLTSAPARIVEPTIAFSIAVMAVIGVFFRRGAAEKAGIIFALGLVHGLGFAGALREIRIPPQMFLSSLAFFNIGIEIGQLAVVAAAAPAVFFLRTRARGEILLQALAIGLAAVGIVWGVVRIAAP